MGACLRDRWLWGLVLVTLAAKAPLLGLNRAEYTDGLILLDLFRNACPFYMPLYPLLCHAVAALGLDPILAGRVVSLLAHGLTLVPIFAVTVWLTDSRPAGRWAALLYTLTPVPTRWALRVMTDSLFALTWWTALAAFLAATECLRRAGARRSSETALARATALCLAAGALGALTRQTGWLLLPLGLLGLFAVIRGGGSGDSDGTPPSGSRALLPIVALALWVPVIAWMLQVGAVGGHGSQVQQRFTWLASLTLIEAYAVDWPLFIGWPLAVLTVMGLVRPIGSGPRWRWFVGVMVWCIIGVLGLQVLIQSYLARYLLPLVGFTCILGGGVIARLARELPRALAPAAAITLGWLALFNASSLWHQREAWGDFRQGAEAMGAAAGPDTLCFTNETYATWPAVGTMKAQWWSGREVAPLLIDTPQGPGLAPMPPGSLVLISSAYGGFAGLEVLMRELYQRYDLELLGQWHARLTPLLPDIGENHQNPLAVRLRHVPQEFETNLLRVRGARGAQP